jgi:TPR repeat protein
MWPHVDRIVDLRVTTLGGGGHRTDGAGSRARARVRQHELGSIQGVRNEHEQAVAWFTEGAEAGLPRATFSLGCCLEDGIGVAALDYPTAADWYIGCGRGDILRWTCSTCFV